MRIKVAIGLVVAFLATLLSVGPASAGVRVIERANGDVLINGDGGENFVDVVLCDDGPDLVYIGDGNNNQSREVIEIDVVDDLTINMKGGNDRVLVRRGFEDDRNEPDNNVAEGCSFGPLDAEDLEGDPDIPGNLKILGASGSDNTGVHGVSIGKDLTVSMSSGDNRFNMSHVHVGDDLTVRASGGRDGVDLYEFWVHDRMDINLSAGNNSFYFGYGSAGRSILRGHNGNDTMNTGGGGPLDLGHNPVVISAGGTDHFRMYGLLWTGKLRLNTGSGSDDVRLHPAEGNGVGVAETRGILDLDTAAGDDDAHIGGYLIPGDDLNGGPGDDQLWHHMDLDQGATIKNFEDIFDYNDVP